VEITVQYTGQLAGLAGVSEELVVLGAGVVMRDLVAQLCERHGASFAGLVMTDGGDLRSALLVIIDGEHTLGDSSQRPLDGIQTILLMTPIAGG
jgi:molybdopterin converting factor small subunit